MANLTYAQVSALLKYEPETGKLFWKERTAADFPLSKRPFVTAKSFNSAFAGKEALAYIKCPLQDGEYNAGQSMGA